MIGIRDAGPSLTGILAGLPQPVTEYGKSIFARSAYYTNYVLVKENQER